MKILMVVPRYDFTNKINYNYTFPLGLAYISSAIKKEGYDVDCLNLNHYNGSVEEIIKRKLDNKKYDVVCTGHMIFGYSIVKKIVDSACNHKSQPKTIIGGSLITCEPELIFESINPDFAIVGEGEKTSIELLKHIKEKKDFRKVNGIIYRDKEGKVTLTEKRKVIEDLDTLPLPDFEGFEFEKKIDNLCTNDSHSNNLFDYPRNYSILCSRGCPFQCTFCYHSLGSLYRTRSIDNIIKELKIAIKKYKINSISIYDDLFSINKERLNEFCKKIKKIIEENDWEIRWDCQLSVRDVDDELLIMLKESGCNIVSFGFESISPKILKSMGKPITPEQIDKAIKLCMKHKVSIQGNFIFGDIAETKETAYATLNYWKKNCKGQIGLGFIQPYPKSKLYLHCLEKGLIKDKLEYIKNSDLTNVFNMTDKMTDKEIEKLRKEMLKAAIKYTKIVVPLSIKNMRDNRYEVKVKCPFCKKKTTYKNFCIENKRYFYEKLIVCRNCNMRFGISSSIRKIIHNPVLYPAFQPLLRKYVRLRNDLLKKKT